MATRSPVSAAASSSENRSRSHVSVTAGAALPSYRGLWHGGRCRRGRIGLRTPSVPPEPLAQGEAAGDDGPDQGAETERAGALGGDGGRGVGLLGQRGFAHGQERN